MRFIIPFLFSLLLVGCSKDRTEAISLVVDGCKGPVSVEVALSSFMETVTVACSDMRVKTK